MIKFLMPILGSLLAMSPAHADWELNMPVGVTDLSAEIYDLHMMVLWRLHDRRRPDVRRDDLRAGQLPQVERR